MKLFIKHVETNFIKLKCQSFTFILMSILNRHLDVKYIELNKYNKCFTFLKAFNQFHTLKNNFKI